MAEVCPNLDKLIRGCKFERRYDTKPPSPEIIAALQPLMDSPFSNMDADFALSELKTETYVRDICIRCGKVVERNPSA